MTKREFMQRLVIGKLNDYLLHYWAGESGQSTAREIAKHAKNCADGIELADATFFDAEQPHDGPYR